MGADSVVMASPCLDQHLSFGEIVEDLAIEKCVAKRPIFWTALAINSAPLFDRIWAGGPRAARFCHRYDYLQNRAFLKLSAVNQVFAANRESVSP